jgi:hypothetical protein
VSLRTRRIGPALAASLVILAITVAILMIARRPPAPSGEITVSCERIEPLPSSETGDARFRLHFVVSNGLSREIFYKVLMLMDRSPKATIDFVPSTASGSLPSGAITNYTASTRSFPGVGCRPLVAYLAQPSRIARLRERIRIGLGFKPSLVPEQRTVAGDRVVPLEWHVPAVDPRIDPRTDESFLKADF